MATPQYTNTQLKQALAKMLPDVIEQDQDNKALFWKHDKFMCIKESELLHLCWLAEETLSDLRDDDQWSHFCIEINAICCPLKCMDGKNNKCGFTIHATWQQRIIALSKAKGVKV